MRISSSHSVLLLATTLVSGLAFFTGNTEPALVVPVLADGETAALEAVVRNVAEVRTGRTHATERVRECRVRWSDGSPVVGAQVVVNGFRAVTDTAGAFVLDAPDIGVDVSATIHPRCWRTPWRGALNAEIVLPSVIDVELEARIDARVTSSLARVGRVARSFRIDGVGPVPERVRVPFRRSLSVALVCGDEPLIRRELTGFTRARPLRVVFDVDADRVVQGRIVDHRGSPLPHAAYSIGGEMFFGSVAGEFVCCPEEARPARVHASYLGRSACSEPVFAGTLGVEVRIDFRDASRLRVVRRGVTIPQFELTSASRLGQSCSPVIPRIPGDAIWSPIATGQPAVPLYLGWIEHGMFHEIPFRLAPGLPGTTTVIDLDRMPVPEFGSLLVAIDSRMHQRIVLEREGGIAYETEVRPDETSSAVAFVSVPVGRYTVRRFDPTSGRALTSQVVVLSPGANALDLTEAGP